MLQNSMSLIQSLRLNLTPGLGLDRKSSEFRLDISKYLLPRSPTAYSGDYDSPAARFSPIGSQNRIQSVHKTKLVGKPEGSKRIPRREAPELGIRELAGSSE